MPANPPSIGPLTRHLIEQCRRDIAAAWEQVEAGRGILNRSAWLLARWAEQARQTRAAPQTYQPRLAGSFQPVETPREKLNPRRLLRARLGKFAGAAAKRLQEQARLH